MKKTQDNILDLKQHELLVWEVEFSIKTEDNE